MAYDEELAGAVRDELSDERDLSERKMFGGLAFLLRGHMAVVVSGRGGIMMRVGHDAADRLAATTNARPAEMRGRPMRGWLRIDAGTDLDGPALTRWVEEARGFNQTLPPKPARPST